MHDSQTRNRPLDGRSPVLALVGLVLLLIAGFAAGEASAQSDGEAVQQRTVERRVVADGSGEQRVIEIADEDGVMSGNAVFVTDGGSTVTMELEPDEEGGYHWVQRDADGRLIEVRGMDEIVPPGELAVDLDTDHRVRAVFIGEDAEPFELRCDGEDCHGMRFGYKVLPGGLGVGRGYLGVVASELTPELRAHFGAPEEAGVLVARVAEESPAALAGLEVGDVITAIDGEAIESGFDLNRRMRRLEAGDACRVEVVRSGRVLAFDVTVAERAVPEVDIETLLLRPRLGEGEGGPQVYTVDPDGVEKHLIRIQERLGSPELRRDVLHLRDVESDLERRIEELERQIEKLTEALEAGG